MLEKGQGETRGAKGTGNRDVSSMPLGLNDFATEGTERFSRDFGINAYQRLLAVKKAG